MAKDELRDGLEVLRGMLERAGETLQEDDENLLLTYGAELEGASEAVNARLDRLSAATLEGFFHSAAAGVRLEVPEALGEGFADSIDDNYPGAGAAFRRLAETFWTLKMLEARVGERHSGITLQQVLRDVVERVERAFFTEPGEERSADDLAADQRQLLARAGVSQHADELLHGNPLLVGNPLA